MDFREITIIYHVGFVLVILSVCATYNFSHPMLYLLSMIYLYQVHDSYIIRLRKKLQHEERKQAHQKRLLSDSETVRWLNHAVEKIWPVCMEQIVSQKVLLPIIPWFLEKYKPWTAKKAVVHHLYLGRTPPMFTEMRVLRQSSDDDHLVLELGMNFLTADDMSAILAVQLRRRLGFGMWAKLHITGMHVEGKVLVGVKFLREWPFLGRLRVCFVEPPYFQMTVKPIVSHGLDVTELPGIAGWLDKLLSVAFEQTLVEPNMLVVDMEKFVSASAGSQENWFTVDEKEPIAYAKVEVIEAMDVKPSDLNGLSDPYVKGQLGPYRFRTKTQKKTLAPKWQEEFKIPVCTWDSPNVLALEVRDKDHFYDDTLGDCSINIGDARDGKRHDMWIPLRNIKMGRLHLAITVFDINEKCEDEVRDDNTSNKNEKYTANETAPEETSNKATANETAPGETSNKATPSKTMPDDFEPINIEGQHQTGIWVHHPGSDVCQSWEPRKRDRKADIKIQKEGNDSIDSPLLPPSGANNNSSSSSDENVEGKKSKSGSVRRSLKKIVSVFHRYPKVDDPCPSDESSPRPLLIPRVNVRAVNERQTKLNIIRDDDTSGVVGRPKSTSPEGKDATSPGKEKMKGMAKSILKHAEHGLKHAEHGLKHVLSRKGSNKSKGGDPNFGSENQESDSSESSQSSIPYKSTVGDVSSDSGPLYTDEVKPPDQNEPIVQTPTGDSTRLEEPQAKIPNVSSENVVDTQNPDVGHEELNNGSAGATIVEKASEEDKR